VLSPQNGLPQDKRLWRYEEKRASEIGRAADGADILVFARAVPLVPATLPATARLSPAYQDTADGESRVAYSPMASKYEAERRANVPPSNTKLANLPLQDNRDNRRHAKYADLRLTVSRSALQS
jgi:hypothetical protein